MQAEDSNEALEKLLSRLKEAGERARSQPTERSHLDKNPDARSGENGPGRNAIDERVISSTKSSLIRGEMDSLSTSESIWEREVQLLLTKIGAPSSFSITREALTGHIGSLAQKVSEVEEKVSDLEEKVRQHERKVEHVDDLRKNATAMAKILGALIVVLTMVAVLIAVWPIIPWPGWATAIVHSPKPSSGVKSKSQLSFQPL